MEPSFPLAQRAAGGCQLMSCHSIAIAHTSVTKSDASQLIFDQTIVKSNHNHNGFQKGLEATGPE